MTVALLDTPKFCREQAVWFFGGTGVVCNYQHKAGTWTYLIKMDLEPDSAFGRIGAETMVLLSEVDLYETEWQMWADWAI
jgi:hypothetical protein